MSLDEREFVSRAAAWAAAENLSTIDTGLAPEEAVRRAREFQRMLRDRQGSPPEEALGDEAIDVLHGACWLLENPGDEMTLHVLQDAALLYEFILTATLSEPDFDERFELLSKCALTAWRAARRANEINACTEWSRKLASHASASSPDCIEAEGILVIPIDQRAVELSGFIVTAEHLLYLLARLSEKRETAPLRVRDEAEFFYRFLAKAGEFGGSADEREYFMGELALIAGTGCRHISRWDEARVWFDRAESGFRLTANALGEISRVAYQRLALQIEERQLSGVLDLAPPLGGTFERLGMPEEALKCRFLEGIALAENGRVLEGVEAFERICEAAEKIGNQKLLALAYTNLTHYFGLLGNSAKAIEALRKAIPVLKLMDDRVALAKVQWGLANLFRATNQIEVSIETYRLAQQEFARIGMRADVAALRLVVADLLLESGKDQEAMSEVLAALPAIDQHKMVHEGFAALSLLRESLRQQKINRQALRDLRGYFEEIRK
jgi:tetratricopeptide (TPR) repeat protein